MPSIKDCTSTAEKAAEKLFALCEGAQRSDVIAGKHYTNVTTVHYSGEVYILTRDTPVEYDYHFPDALLKTISNQVWFGELGLWGECEQKGLVSRPKDAKYLIWFQDPRDPRLNEAIETDDLKYGEVAFLTEADYQKYFLTPRAKGLIYVRDHRQGDN